MLYYFITIIISVERLLSISFLFTLEPLIAWLGFSF